MTFSFLGFFISSSTAVHFYTVAILHPSFKISNKPNLTRAYDNNGRCPRQKFVFGILQLFCKKICKHFENASDSVDFKVFIVY